MQTLLGYLKRGQIKERIEVLKNIILALVLLTFVMDVGDIAKPDSVLLMWVCDPLLDQAFKVINAWGFKYKTVGFTWAKTNKNTLGFFTGLGYWTRGNPEMCLPQLPTKKIK